MRDGGEEGTGLGSPAGSINIDRVGEILKSLGVDETTQKAASLAPTFDGSERQRQAVKKQYGDEISQLLFFLHKLLSVGSQVEPAIEEQTPQRIETLRRMLLALAEDVRVVVIALAIHLARLEELAKAAKDDPDRFGLLSRALGDETLKVQAPLANRLGIWQMKWALEDFAFRMTEPEVYKKIAGLLDEKRLERESFVAQTCSKISTLLKAQNISAEVAGRPKHLFSIRNKMRAKNLRFEELRDIRAFRVLVDTEAQCYSVLGILHDEWQPMAEEFDDYITRPKSNGYQSLHTVLLDADARPFEVQIRTHEMHRLAELGVAAHWKYKESEGSVAAQGEYEQKIAWVRQMLDWGRGDLGQVKLSDDRIYALTPHARIIELPKGATPLDFAYHLHTEVGHRCRGAKIDGQIVPLTTEIQTGQTVELMTVREGSPSRDWMNPESGYLKSARARQKVRSYFYALEAPPEETLPTQSKAETELEASSREALAEQAILSRIGKARDSIKGEVLVVGVDRMLTALARCCKPAPPDEIVGFVTRGKGVSVHRAQCPTFARMSQATPERVIATQWGEQRAGSEARYPIDAVIHAKSRPDLLRDIAEVLAREKIPLIRINSFPKGDQVTMIMTLQVTDGYQLSKALSMLRDITGVQSASRA